MDFDTNSVDKPDDTDTIFVGSFQEESSESQLPALEDWSSLEIKLTEENPKIKLYREGLYSPGSGEVCGKYFSMSNSSIFRHHYYSYPAVHDPGIVNALLNPEKKPVYGDDGQDLYLALCKELGQCPVRLFHKGLLSECINLRYYCVDSVGVQAMSKALEKNGIVRILDFTESFLSVDACYHLGEMLIENRTLEELILDCCKINADGAHNIFQSLTNNKSLRALNLNRNEIGDKGIDYLADRIVFGFQVKEMYLSKNSLTKLSLVALTEALEVRNTFTHVDLSNNNLNTPYLSNFLIKLAEDNVLESLNLSWNYLSGEKIGTALGYVFKSKNFNTLNLSYNKFFGEAANLIAASIRKAKKLKSLNFSFNPLTMENAMTIISKFKFKSKIQEINLDGVTVNEKFIEAMKVVQQKNKDVIILHGYLQTVFKSQGIDARELLLKRVDFLMQGKKKKKVDFALVILQMIEDGFVEVDAKTLEGILAEYGTSMDTGLFNAMSDAFAIATTKKKQERKINITLLGDFITRYWPDRKLPPKPPTPPPEPEPEPIPEPVKEKKGKKKK